MELAWGNKRISILYIDLAGNATSEMGHLMFSLASDSDFKKTSSREEFISKINSSSYSKEFMSMYNDYIKRFGARGYMEIDVATKRQWEDIGEVYDRINEIDTENSQISKAKGRREMAYNKLLKLAKEKGKGKTFMKQSAAMQATLGYREHPKYVIVYVLGKLHDVLLEVG